MDLLIPQLTQPARQSNNLFINSGIFSENDAYIHLLGCLKQFKQLFSMDLLQTADFSRPCGRDIFRSSWLSGVSCGPFVFDTYWLQYTYPPPP